jgi:SAM-dependent methyltransferase
MTLPQWDDYWRTGWVVSCPTGPMSGYTGEVRVVWERFFSRLEAGARLLDLGTGNGALPLVALDVARSRGVDLEIHGVDLAEIDPRRDVPDGGRLFQGVQFHPGVAAESMPFPDGCFQAACGQYALEYTDVEGSLAELRRVLAGHARVQFVLHHADSIVARNARESLQHIEIIEQRADAFGLFRDYVAAERAGDAAAAAAQFERLSGAMREVHAIHAGARSPQTLAGILQALARLFELRTRMTPEQFDRALVDTHRAFKAAERRLQDLLGAVLDDQAVERLLETARRQGFVDFAAAPLRQDEATLVGWLLTMSAS